MTEPRSVAYVYVENGAIPSDVAGGAETCYFLPEVDGAALRTMGILKRAGFLLGSADTPRPPEPEPEEKAHVVLLFGTYQEGLAPLISGDSTRYYYLPGANRSETMEALEEAGFERDDRCKAMTGEYL